LLPESSSLKREERLVFGVLLTLLSMGSLRPPLDWSNLLGVAGIAKGVTGSFKEAPDLFGVVDFRPGPVLGPSMRNTSTGPLSLNTKISYFLGP